MAQPTKHAALICLILSIVAAAGGVAAYFATLPFLLAAAMLPAAIYEFVRTEGRSTKTSSFLIGLALAAQVVVLLAGIRLDLTAFLARTGVQIPLPAALLSLTGVLAVANAVLAVILFGNTRGVYTRWMAGLLFVGSAVLLFLLAPAEVLSLFR